jgi:hypothetical protein
MKAFTLLLLAFLLSSCAGYRVRTKGNPFEDSHIKTLAVPLFVNHSLFPGVGPIFTREIMKVLSTYSDLRLQGSASEKSDAVLIGIVTSPDRYRDTFRTTQIKFTSGELKDSIGDRAQFNVPTSSSYQISVRLVMIKNPSVEEKELIVSSLGEKILKSPRVIFNRTLSYTGNFNRESKDTVTSDSGGVVNYTKTKRFFEQTVESLAVSTAKDFEDLVINVF